MKHAHFLLLVLIGITSCQACHISSTFQEKIDFLKKNINLNANDLIFDVGANIGEMTDLYLACGARVVCFEPNPSCQSILHEKFDGNDRVLIDHNGLGSKESDLDFYISTKASTISSFSEEWTRTGRFVGIFEWDKKNKAHIITLDQAIAKYGLPKFCKIDVEGFEHEVIEGLSQKIPIISFEINFEFFNNSSKKTFEQLIRLGYEKFNFAQGNHAHLIFEKWATAQECLQKIEFLGSNNTCDKRLLWGDAYTKL